MENKAHQDDFYVLGFSLAQTLHRLLLPMNSVVPKWNPHPWVSEAGKEQTGNLCMQSRASNAQALQRNLLPTLSSPMRTALTILPHLSPHSRELGSNRMKKGLNENLPSNFRKISILSGAGHTWKIQMKIWRHLIRKTILFKGVVTIRRGLARVLSKGCVSVCVSTSHHSHSLPAV